MAEVQFGWLIRSIHSWGANLMIFMVFVHLFSVMLLKAYRTPRELTWMTGVVLLFVALGLGFTGYLLPWNTLAFFATRVGTEIPGVMPVVGPFLRKVLRGGDDVTGRDADPLLRAARLRAARRSRSCSSRSTCCSCRSTA